MLKQFEGQVALVTGAGSGIGRASAMAFAQEGAKVIVSDITVEGGLETVRLIKEAGGEAAFVKADVSNALQVEALVGKAIETYGGLNYAHNNAGIEGNTVPFTECTEENWDRVININLKGVWLCMKYEVSHMAKHGGGAIVNMSSVGGLVGFNNNGAYVASKHGVIGLTKVVALEYAKAGIRVNAVCPCAVQTPMIGRLMDHGRPAAVGPIGRMALPEEVAAAVIWLCSNAASIVTAHAMSVDGGYVAR